jgi:hypothetical protein
LEKVTGEKSRGVPPGGANSSHILVCASHNFITISLHALQN